MSSALVRRKSSTELSPLGYKPRMLRKPWLMAALLIGCALLVALASGPRLLQQSRAPLLDVGTAQQQP